MAAERAQLLPPAPTRPSLHAPPPHATLAQLSWAPTTQTTVVTTTKTVTTAFPPFLLKPPKHLAHHNPELYPLAATPTPRAIRKLQFDVGGQTAVFEEASDTAQAIRGVRLHTRALLWLRVTSLSGRCIMLISPNSLNNTILVFVQIVASSKLPLSLVPRGSSLRMVSSKTDIHAPCRARPDPLPLSNPRLLNSLTNPGTGTNDLDWVRVL